MSETGLDRAALAARLPDPAATDGIEADPSLDDLRSYSAHLETTTEHGSPAYVSEFRSRCAERTRNTVDHEFDADDRALVEDAVDAVADPGDREFVAVDRVVGRHPEVAQVCRLFVPKEYGRIALAWAKLLEPAPEGAEPDLQTVVRGSDYTGEAKKSFLRLFMRRAKEAGGLGLHAGSKRVVLDDADGRREVGQLFLGLSGTGKSTLTGHRLWLEAPEYAELLQDDVCALLPDGTVAGGEGAGLYIKTHGLAADEQPALHDAATDSSAVLENVAVDGDGRVNFDDGTLTRNGRAVVERAALPSAADDVDLPGADQVFFITRNRLMPPVARLDDDQAAAAFMLGESVQTSAGDPDAAGERLRVVGTNPFVVGPAGAEGNRFRELVADNDVDCFLLNTGSVGDADVRVDDTVALLESLARGAVEWRHDETVGLAVPDAAPGVDLDRLDPVAGVEDYAAKVAELRAERREYLAGFPELDDAVVDAAY